jgi:predicted sulfurtransferase
VVYCTSGYRSSIAASLLERHGLDDVTDLADGIRSWLAARAAQQTRLGSVPPLDGESHLGCVLKDGGIP